MSFSLLILTSLVISNLVFSNILASAESLNEIASQVAGCPADAEESWTYRGSNGPASWGQTYPQCDGSRQSPIAVDSSKVLMDDNLEQLQFVLYNYPIVYTEIVNDGKTIKLLPDYLGRDIYVNGTFYGLYEIHFHWGSTMRRGSEHIIDGKQYAMEMHLVHKRRKNEKKKKNRKDEVNRNDEYAVVAVFFEQGPGINAELQHIVNELPKVMYKNTTVISRWRVNLLNLLPELHMTSFYYYNGSLTAPDCAENVSWILLKTPVFIGNTQIREFRKLFSATQEQADLGCRITGNIRPVQHLHGRQVYSSK